MCITGKRRRQRKIQKYIDQADDFEITEMIQAIIRKYGRVYPDWEVSFISMHKDPQLRKQDVEGIIYMLRQSVK